ncbi:LysR family transcriptional regulator [Amycolatopsis regifaucium]|uniref:LysR family transcriptional regulator n=1 Tax=Amycolatopsis regifaucium TaxID=546365 RepID=A0A154M3F9_9PSEU|nr:LysR family transcriptional regulator [Amycolatopsis regifaucium]KZB79144.1 LysR family transcriptional regulator [Amycolatopsis regifaucium]OKA07329.1 LysR family transcriptional regulator [Amycolatopsis regifaucium]SFH14222.1 DNA-binding transcriptional regulator, LysR family [Amycolatopsis regifaucium]
MVVDLIGGCRAFVSVSEAGSFTAGAALARIPQPVASRRIAALERHFGERLFDRSTRRARLTPFGRDMLPSAKRLVTLADAMEHDAQRARLRPTWLAMPEICTTRELAELDAAARALDVFLEFRQAPPRKRAELVRTQEVRAALTTVPGEEGTWKVTLGLAGTDASRAGSLHLETLRVGRSGRVPRRVWIQPEDDVPHLRDRLFRVRDSVGLRPTQVTVADSLTAAAAAVFGSADLLLCSTAQATELGLAWRPIGEIRLVRGYEITAGLGEDAQRLRARLWPDIARCLGAEETT